MSKNPKMVNLNSIHTAFLHVIYNANKIINEKENCNSKRDREYVHSLPSDGFRSKGVYKKEKL